MNYLGIDIGGTDVKAVVLNNNLSAIHEESVPSLVKLGVEPALQNLKELVTRVRGRFQINAIGVGCAGSIDHKDGIVRNSPNFKDWNNVPLKSYLEKQTGLPIVLHNDANCAAYTEWRLGKGVGSKNLVLLTFGTGIGGGLILNGQLYTGSTGTAGELGHFAIFANGEPCPCGHSGCFERYCSASTVQNQIKTHSAEQVFKNPELFPDFVSHFKSNLASAITTFANVFDPDWILLGGGVSKGFVSFLTEIKDHVATHAFPAVGKHVKIELAQFGNWSGSLGAACLAKDSFSF